jgi:PKD repeat protein
MKRCLYLCIFLILILGERKSFAQTDTEFWFAVPKVTEGHGWDTRNFFFRFANLNLENEITISMPGNPAFSPIVSYLAPYEALTVNVTEQITQLWTANPNQVYNRGIKISASNYTTAYFEVGTHFNPDIFSLKGRNSLGTDFFVPFQNYFRNGNYSPQPYSGIYIVATEDNTEITVTPTRPVFPGRPAGVPFTLNLDRGQTIAVVPEDYSNTGQLPANHLGGTRVESDKPIAVTTSDDSVAANPHGGCRDLIGDQLIPASIIGTEYIAMKGRLTIPEFFYVLATETNTQVEIDGVVDTILQPGEQLRRQFSQQTHFIKTSKPSYVYHVTGFGCEMAGAVLPPINVCTGSTRVSFTRSKAESFFLNILVRAGAEDGFIFAGQGPNTVIQASDFQVITGTTDWLAAEFEFSPNAQVPVGVPVGEVTLIENTKNVFHLGVINGGPTSGTMYGYFSDFNHTGVQANISGADTIVQSCYGDPVQLVAHGGVSYLWQPPDFLDDPTSPTPIATPESSIQYTVFATGACQMVDSASVFIEVGEQVIADFSVNVTEGCSPIVVELTNNSVGASTYQWHMGDGTILEESDVSYIYTNLSSDPVVYEITLISTSDISCVDTATIQITVFPEVQTELSADVLFGCNPLYVTFQHQTTGAISYYWDFGDGNSSYSAQPEINHLFYNDAPHEATYAVSLTASSEYGCADIDIIYIQVLPDVVADFTIDSEAFCSPHELIISNVSLGADDYLWSFDGGTTFENFSEFQFYYFFENDSEEPLVFDIWLIANNNYGCADTIVRSIIVFPEVKSEFLMDMTEGCSPLEVYFSNLSLGAQDFLWDFGTGTETSSEMNPIATFENPGFEEPETFTITLLATSQYLCSDSSSAEVTVYPNPMADFSFDYITPNNVAFFNQSQGGATFFWDFGDGNTSTSAEAEIIHVFENQTNEDVIFAVSLLTENMFGCLDTSVKDVLILPEEPEVFEVVFNLDMSGLQDFNGDDHNVFITGSMLGWLTPGFDPENQQMVNIADSKIWTISMLLESGQYEYKYFRETGSQSGEWESAENRIVFVDGATVVNDTWQQQTNISYPVKSNKVVIYPNPGRDIVKVESSDIIKSISLFTLTGKTLIQEQEVMSYNFELDFGKFESGIYVIHFSLDHGFEAQKLTIIK